ncbi:hypothetical protein ACHAWC_003261, partial [Mediolabrus comicus]
HCHPYLLSSIHYINIVSITTTINHLIILLAVGGVSAFAPPKSSSSRQQLTTSTTQKLSLINDFTFLISDAADAIVDAADVITDAVVATADQSNTAAAVDSASTSSFNPTYSKASYYTTLALYVASFPGLWSQIKRSTKAKVKRKTYVSDGEMAATGEGGKSQRQQAAEAGETITFRGLVARSTSQAFFLTFCTALGMASLALVLQIQFQDLELPVIGKPNWFLLTLLSPYAGIYYWKSGDRVDDMKVKLSTNDDETLNEITIEGNDEEIDRMWRTLDLREKGMVKVEGILS